MCKLLNKLTVVSFLLAMTLHADQLKIIAAQGLGDTIVDLNGSSLTINSGLFVGGAYEYAYADNIFLGLEHTLLLSPRNQVLKLRSASYNLYGTYYINDWFNMSLGLHIEAKEDTYIYDDSSYKNIINAHLGYMAQAEIIKLNSNYCIGVRYTYVEYEIPGITGIVDGSYTAIYAGFVGELPEI